MKCTPPAIAEDDLQTAVDPEIGGEKQLLISVDPWQLIADVSQPAENSGVAAMNPLFSLTQNGPLDLQFLSVNGARSDEEIVVSFACTFDDNTTGPATATFAIPQRSPNQAASVPAGTAVDLVAPAVNGVQKKIKAVNGITTFVGGSSGNRFRLVAMPEDASYTKVGFVTEAGLKLPVSGSVAIADGLDGSAAIKRGRSEPGTMSAKSHYIDYMNGLGRINGFFVTARIDVLKDDRVLTERVILGRWKAMANPSRGDGNDVVSADAEGNFQEFAVFTAP